MKPLADLCSVASNLKS